MPSGILMVAGAVIGAHYGKLSHPSANEQIVGWVGDAVFLISSFLFINFLTSSVRKVMSSRRLGEGRAASMQFIFRVIGYIVVLLITLSLFNISVGKVLLGGALLGIILGVAAQQALGNFFASVVLTASHPFAVGQRVVLTSGSLGGQYEGVIKDIGLIYTKLVEDNGNTVLLPNATILSGASIRMLPRKPK